MSSTARALHIFIPEPQSTFFSLYAHCALAGKSYHSERNGTFLLTKGGAVILFYTFTHHHRRAYIVCPWLTLSPDVPPTKLLGVTEPVAVLYHAQGSFCVGRSGTSSRKQAKRTCTSFPRSSGCNLAASMICITLRINFPGRPVPMFLYYFTDIRIVVMISVYAVC